MFSEKRRLYHIFAIHRHFGMLKVEGILAYYLSLDFVPISLLSRRLPNQCSIEDKCLLVWSSRNEYFTELQDY